MEKILYPLTHPQKAIYYTEKVYPNTSISNLILTVILHEEVDYCLLAKVLNLVIEKNDALRFRMVEKDSEPKQYIAPYEEHSFQLMNFSDSGGHKALSQWMNLQNRIPIVLIDSELVYFTLIKIRDNEGGFYLKFHHIISDAWTIVHLVNNVIEYYTQLKEGLPVLEANPSYLDYIQSEQTYKESKRFENDRLFWLEKFNTTPEYITWKDSNQPIFDTAANRMTYPLDKKLSHSISEYCKHHRTSIFTLFLSVLSTYLYRMTAKADLVIGTPILNRSNAKEKRTAGMFISTNPIRLFLNPENTFAEYLKYVSKIQLTYFKRQRYPYDLLLKEFRERNHNYSRGCLSNLYDVSLSYQNATFHKQEHRISYKTEWQFNGYASNALTIHINDRELEGNIIIDYDYLIKLFDDQEIERINGHLINMVTEVIADSSKKLHQLKLLTEQEKKQLLDAFNNTNAEYPRDKTIGQLFEEKVERTPDNLAVVFENKNLTYRELNEKSNQLARVLRRQGAKPNSIVGIMVDRSIEMVIGIMGVLKAGAAYLPIDTRYPRQRAEYMLNNTNADLLLTQNHLINMVEFKGNVINLEEELDISSENLPNLNRQTDLAYVIFTSGSTGNPKGVMIEHRNVVRLLFNSKFQFDFTNHDVWTMFHSFSFDFSVWEIFGALLDGAKLIIVPQLSCQNPSEYLKILKDQQVTIVNQTPTALNNLINETIRTGEFGLNIRYIILGGEALKPAILEGWMQRFPGLKIINMYGITETTVHVTFKEMAGRDIQANISNVGGPIPTTATYIMDGSQNLLPIGAMGEIYVGGAGVGRGYLNLPNLTNDKFVKNPHRPDDIIYRSGDLGRLLANGEIEYIGRIDNQVQLKGFRIELGEIENCLLTHHLIRDAVVIDRVDGSGKLYLCAYIVSEEVLLVSELRNHLAEKLPDYMIPASFVFLTRIPLTPNGKVDRNSLPEPEGNLYTGVEYIAPKTQFEIRMTNLLAEILDVKKVGIDDNFFELGGDSLNAASILTSLKDDYCQLKYQDLYQYPTVRQLSEKLESSLAGKSEVEHEYLIDPIGRNDQDFEIGLIVVPYGGGNFSVFKNVSEELLRLSKKIMVYGVNLPGHLGETSGNLINIHEVAKSILREAKSKLPTDVFIYGHCVGSALAIEIARLMNLESYNVPTVIIGASLIPQFVKIYGGFLSPWAFVSDKKIITYLKSLGEKKFEVNDTHQSIIMKAFRHDAINYLRYLSKALWKKRKINSPIWVVIGDHDLSTKNYSKQYSNWEKVTNKRANLKILKEANHYFLHSHAKDLAEIIYEIIQKHDRVDM